MPYKNPEDLRMSTAKYRAARRAKLSENQRAYYAANRPRYLANVKARRRADPRLWMLRAARNRAKSRGIPFNLVIDDIQIPECCPIFGTPFVYGDKELTASLDRLVPERGYVRGNIAVICRLANTIKNCSTTAQIKRIAEWMESQNIP